MKLPWLMYLIVGVFILGFSYYTTEVKGLVETNKFGLFYAFGGLFCLIGLGKLLAVIFSRMRDKKPHAQTISELPQHGHRASHAVQSPQHQGIRAHKSHQAHPHPSQAHIQYCAQCGSAMRGFDRFCYRCGNANT